MIVWHDNIKHNDNRAKDRKDERRRQEQTGNTISAKKQWSTQLAATRRLHRHFTNNGMTKQQWCIGIPVTNTTCLKARTRETTKQTKKQKIKMVKHCGTLEFKQTSQRPSSRENGMKNTSGEILILLKGMLNHLILRA